MQVQKFWTPEEENLLKELVSQKLSRNQIGKILNRTPASLSNRFQKLGIESLFIPNRKYSFNEDFWAVPNLLNSYWAGFSAADACITKSKQSYKYALSLSTKDLNHLERFKNDCGYTGNIESRVDLKSINNNPNKAYYTSRMLICSLKWGQDLENIFNILPNKTFRLSPPKLPHYLLMSWLIGYIDGDGSISIKKDGKGLRVDFISGSEEIIKWIKEFIDNNFKDRLANHREDNYYKRKGRNSYHLIFVVLEQQ